MEEKVRIAAETGYDAIEPWEGELRDYERDGGSLEDLGRRIADAGLFVPSVIGLWNAIPPTREAFALHRIFHEAGLSAPPQGRARQRRMPRARVGRSRTGRRC